jgi:hypothetical protein
MPGRRDRERRLGPSISTLSSSAIRPRRSPTGLRNAHIADAQPTRRCGSNTATVVRDLATSRGLARPSSSATSPRCGIESAGGRHASFDRAVAVPIETTTAGWKSVRNRLKCRSRWVGARFKVGTIGQSIRTSLNEPVRAPASLNSIERVRVTIPVSVPKAIDQRRTFIDENVTIVVDAIARVGCTREAQIALVVTVATGLGLRTADPKSRWSKAVSVGVDQRVHAAKCAVARIVSAVVAIVAVESGTGHARMRREGAALLPVTTIIVVAVSVPFACPPAFVGASVVIISVASVIAFLCRVHDGVATARNEARASTTDARSTPGRHAGFAIFAAGVCSPAVGSLRK